MEFTKMQIRTRQKMAPSDAKKLVGYVKKTPNIVNGVVIKRNIGQETADILNDAGILFKDGVGDNKKDIEDAMASLNTELTDMINSNYDDNSLDESSDDDSYNEDYIDGYIDEFDNDIIEPTMPKFKSLDIHVIKDRLRFKDAKKINETALNHPTKLIGLVCIRGISKKAQRTLLPSIQVTIPETEKGINACKQILMRRFDDLVMEGVESNENYDESMEFLKLNHEFVKMAKLILNELYIPTLSIDVVRSSVGTALRCASKIHNISLAETFQKYPNAVLKYIEPEDQLREKLKDRTYANPCISFVVGVEEILIDTHDRNPNNWKVSVKLFIGIYDDGEKINTTIKKFDFTIA